MPFLGLVPLADAGLGERPSAMDPLRRLLDRNPLTVASLSLFLDRRSCASISSSPPSASFSREVVLESEVLPPFTCTEDAPTTGNVRELTVLPAAAYSVRPVSRGWRARLLDPGLDPDPALVPRDEAEVISWCGRKCRFKLCNARLAAEVETPGLVGLHTGVLLPDVDGGLSKPFHPFHGGVGPLEGFAASARDSFVSNDDHN